MPSVLFMVHSSTRFGDEYDSDFQASDKKGLQAFSESVGSYQTVTHIDGVASKSEETVGDIYT